uniref:Fe2OG dioxygenase domain-containing protein n=1 Tax=Ananas comosus var. bracteatus TaxID=296719 RepID=A0A6V7P6I5_ANACO|nr:unnamed protein product [Ananas comosus var. bracteatus]
MGSEPKTAIPIVDLSPFLCGGGGGDEAGVKLATETIGEACRHYGFFWIVNHGVPREHMARAIELSQAFFALPDEEKRKVKPAEGSKAPLPAGYSRQPEHSADKNEYLMVFSPEFGFNLYPNEPRTILEECFCMLSKTALIVQDIVNECMGLPANFLKEYNSNRSFDFMTALRYFPTTGAGDNRLSEHQDGNCLTFVFQDDIGGLEVLKDGEWIPVDPTDGSIIVNVGDIFQVLSNNKFKSAMHRVTRKSTHRHSFAYFFNLHGKKCMDRAIAAVHDGHRREATVQEIPVQRIHPAADEEQDAPSLPPEDVIHITHYAV